MEFHIHIFHNVVTAKEKAPVAISGNLHNKPNTTDLTGEYEDRFFATTRGDSRIYLSIAKNEFTTKLTRSNRFLIDDPDSPIMLSYQLTKPMKLGSFYNNKGVYKFVMQEVNSTDDDNRELGIADYYKHFPKDDIGDDGEETEQPGKKVWL